MRFLNKDQSGSFAGSGVRRYLRVFMALGLCLGLSACADPNYCSVAPVATNVAPVAPPAETLPEYRVQIGDVLDVNFYMNPELNETVTVRPDGMISTRIVEGLRVYNSTVPEINRKLRAAYKAVLINPTVRTVVRSYAPVRIYVSGEVNTPGEYLVVGQALTLTQAIARAGGVKNSGLQNKVLIIRRGSSEKPKIFTADYFGATQGGDPSKDTRLAPFDVVFVPKTGVAVAYTGYQQYVQQWVNPTLGAAYVIPH